MVFQQIVKAETDFSLKTRVWCLFWPREKLKSTKRSFVVVGVETKTKNTYSNLNKNVQTENVKTGTKYVHSEKLHFWDGSKSAPKGKKI